MKSGHDFRLNSLIELLIRLPLPAEGNAKVRAHVTRKLNGAVAVEWCDFAPQAVRELLRSHEIRGPRQGLLIL